MPDDKRKNIEDQRRRAMAKEITSKVKLAFRRLLRQDEGDSADEPEPEGDRRPDAPDAADSQRDFPRPTE